LRLRGLLAQLAENDREIARVFDHQRGTVTQQFTSRGLFKSTACDSALRELYRREEADRSRSREQWYSGLAPADRAALDDHWLAIAGAVLHPLFPPELPASLHGPLARLALEDAVLARRFAARRDETEKSLIERRLGNRTVVVSILRGITGAEDEARSRLEGRWFRELTLEQQAAFDSYCPEFATASPKDSVPAPPSSAPVGSQCRQGGARTPDAPPSDGLQPPRWLWLNGTRYEIGKPRSRRSWLLLAFFGDRQFATYEDLQGPLPSGPGEPAKPWSDPVGDSAIATAVNRFNNEMPSALPWKLTTAGRCVCKESRENPAV
jgi:hypothetical protein